MRRKPLFMVALSGGVDSAVAAGLLLESGAAVECIHMTNWEDEDGYCQAAEDYQDARRVAARLGVPLHRVNFSAEYYADVFAEFLREHAAGRTPNPDVLCNREIKFGVLRKYARRLGADLLATGHYARLRPVSGGALLLRARDSSKDQSYFLHAVSGADLADVAFPIGECLKTEVRAHARRMGLPVARKKDSTGICFIGERPFTEFLARHLPYSPGRIETADGHDLGEHCGLPFYTIGQRHGLGIGGLHGAGGEPWYVAAKDLERNVLVVVQGREHPLLYDDSLEAADMHWIAEPPRDWIANGSMECAAKTRYRQQDAPCRVTATARGIRLEFRRPQWAVTPGQFAVLYQGDRCLGGARIERALSRSDALPEAV